MITKSELIVDKHYLKWASSTAQVKLLINSGNNMWTQTLLDMKFLMTLYTMVRILKVTDFRRISISFVLLTSFLSISWFWEN